MLTESQAGYAWVTADADVHILNIGVPPESAAMGGYGKRLLALGYGSNDGITRAWESTDGGGSFSEIATTGAVTGFFQNGGDTSISCDAGGCLLGDTVARVGWEGQAEVASATLDTSVPELTGKLGGAISCELTPRTKWAPIRGSALGVTFPRLSDLMRGKEAWSLATQDPSTHAIDVTSASVPDKDSDASIVSTHSLLGPIGGQGTTAWTLQTQAEGYVAARSTVPERAGALDKKPVSVEVSWANFYAGSFGRRTITDAGTWDAALLSGATSLRGMTQATLTPAIISITGPGVVFRALASAPKTFFVDGQARTTVFDYPDWSSLGIERARSDAAMPGSEVFPAGFVELATSDGQPLTQSFALAHKPAGASGYEVATVAFADSNAETSWGYLDGTSGVESTNPDVDGNRGEAFGMFVKADGTLSDPVALPTLADLPEKPRGCTPDDRKGTPRAFMPVFSRRGPVLYPNGRRAIVVSEAKKDPKSSTTTEPTWFLSDGAVLFGTPKDPCVGAFRGSSAGHGLVVVIAGDMTHAWMFRPAAVENPACGACPDDPLCSCASAAPTPGDRRRRPPPKPARTADVEWRPMTCAYKPELAPPPDVTSSILARAPEDAD